LGEYPHFLEESNSMDGTHHESQFFAGFTFSGNQNLDALAGFYGLALPSLEPQITLAQYLARSCYGRPCAGYRIMTGNVELIVRELEGGAITKVGLRLLPQAPSRQRKRLPANAGYNIGASLVRRSQCSCDSGASELNEQPPVAGGRSQSLQSGGAGFGASLTQAVN
jgi:NhaP-type Na+/H+ and K+/H+ antiporter